MEKGKRQNYATQSQNLKATETRPAAAEAAPMTPLLYPSLSASSPPPYQGTTFEQPHSNYIEATKNPRKLAKAT